MNPPPPAPQQQPEQCTPNWLELPKDVAASILLRLGPVEILQTVQLVCTTWGALCKDPSMWRSIDMTNLGDIDELSSDMMCRQAVDRSSGGLQSISIESFANDYLLRYISERSSNLKSLRLVKCYDISQESLSYAIKKMPLLEELELSYCQCAVRASLEDVGRSCPLLKSLKLNDQATVGEYFEDFECNDEAMAIAKTMPGLRRLQIFGNSLTNDGLQAILDGCPHLESLDLRQCFYVKLEGSLGRTCAERIRVLRLPNDSTDDYPYDCEMIGDPDGSISGMSDYDDYDDLDLYDGYDGYDSDFNYTGKFSASDSDESFIFF